MKVDNSYPGTFVQGVVQADSLPAVDCGTSPLNIAPPYSGVITTSSHVAKVVEVSGVSADISLASFRVWKGLDTTSILGGIGSRLVASESIPYGVNFGTPFSITGPNVGHK